MPEKRDIVIIGGGVIGVCAAYYLQQAGRPVTLIEKDDIAAGSSYGNAGLIVPSHIMPLATPGAITKGARWLLDPVSPLYIKPRVSGALANWLLRFVASSRTSVVKSAMHTMAALNAESVSLYEDLSTTLDLPFGYERRGGLFAFTTLKGQKEGFHEAHALQEHGVSAVRLSSPADVRAIEPNVSDRVISGVYVESDAHLVPHEFVRGLAGLVKQRGGEILTQTGAEAFHSVGRRVTNVVTNNGTFAADWVVIATGAWSPAVGRLLGISLPIQPAKGYSITLQRPASAPAVPVHMFERKVVATPMGDRLRIAGTLELAGYNETINARRVSALRTAMREYLTLGDDLNEIETWYGWRPLTPNTLPIIGPSTRWDNLMVATGHGMLGMSLGPVTGKLVADMICERPINEAFTALGPR